MALVDDAEQEIALHRADISEQVMLAERCSSSACGSWSKPMPAHTASAQQRFAKLLRDDILGVDAADLDVGT